MPKNAIPPLPPALDAERHEFEGRAGRLSYYKAGEGEPLLLFHSINASGSAFEVKPVFEHYRHSRTVYAIDLPGFGFSDRSDRHYSPRLYTDAIHDLLSQVPGSGPVDALALSLASEYVARAATESPERFRSLALVTPTGFNKGSHKMRAPEGATREVKWLYKALTVPLWRQGLYRLLVKPSVIRYFLKRTWGSDDYDESLAVYDEATTKQPGAEYAPLAFLSARLFSKDIRNVYEQLTLPVWVPHATRGDFKDFSETDWAREKGNWTFQAMESGALPFFELPDEFFTSFDGFLNASIKR
ncbi:MAG: alpha/beta fold hydrolase [Woeseiaceae bacterium]